MHMIHFLAATSGVALSAVSLRLTSTIDAPPWRVKSSPSAAGISWVFDSTRSHKSTVHVA